MFIALAAALACSAWGLDQRSAEPRLPRALASDLAESSDAIAAALDAGDVCGAAGLADEPKNAADSAVASGQVPAEFSASFEGAALELQNGVNCTAEPEEGKKDGKRE